jgi:hypothetical protein
VGPFEFSSFAFNRDILCFDKGNLLAPRRDLDIADILKFEVVINRKFSLAFRHKERESQNED